MKNNLLRNRVYTKLMAILLVLILAIVTVGLTNVQGTVADNGSGGVGSSQQVPQKQLSTTQQSTQFTQTSSTVEQVKYEFDVNADNYYEQLQAAGVDPNIRPTSGDIPSDARLGKLVRGIKKIDASVEVQASGEMEIVKPFLDQNEKAQSIIVMWGCKLRLYQTTIVNYEIETWRGGFLWFTSYVRITVKSVEISHGTGDYYGGSVSSLSYYTTIKAGNNDINYYLGSSGTFPDLGASGGYVYRPDFYQAVVGEGGNGNVKMFTDIKFRASLGNYFGDDYYINLAFDWNEIGDENIN